MSNLGVPQFIKCALCRKNRQNVAYSNKQLSDYKIRLGKSRDRAELPRCRECTGGQVTELTCVNCGATRGLSSFAKAQRANADTARCIDCVQDHLDAEPNVEDAIYEDMNENRSGYDTSSFDTTSIRQSLSGVTISTASTASEISDTSSRAGISSQGDDDEEEDGDHSRVWAPAPSTSRTPRAMSANSVGEGNAGFAKLKAVGPSLDERRQKEKEQEERYRDLEANRSQLEEHEGEDDEKWEL